MLYFHRTIKVLKIKVMETGVLVLQVYKQIATALSVCLETTGGDLSMFFGYHFYFNKELFQQHLCVF